MKISYKERIIKNEEIKKCLLSAKKLGNDLMGLFNNNIVSGIEAQFVHNAMDYLDSITSNLACICKDVKEKDIDISKDDKEQKHKRGSVKL